LYIETWSQFVNKKHLIDDEAVKLAVAFLKYGKIRSEISRCRRIFVTEMLIPIVFNTKCFKKNLYFQKEAKGNLSYIQKKRGRERETKMSKRTNISTFCCIPAPFSCIDIPCLLSRYM